MSDEIKTTLTRRELREKGHDYGLVEHGDGAVHIYDIRDWDKPGYDQGPLWRLPSLCGTGTGVSSDEGGHAAVTEPTEATCWMCVSLLS